MIVSVIRKIKIGLTLLRVTQTKKSETEQSKVRPDWALTGVHVICDRIISVESVASHRYTGNISSD